jgi:hypothetical protein
VNSCLYRKTFLSQEYLKKAKIIPLFFIFGLLMAMSVRQTIRCQMIGWLINDELNMAWNKVAITLLKAEFWNIKPRNPFKVNQRSGGTCHLHLLGQRGLLATCFHDGFLVGLFFEPEGGGDVFLRNIG